jgi:DNA-binding IclR family transcriptional regulator
LTPGRTSDGKAVFAALWAATVDELRPWPGSNAGSLPELHAELDRVRRRGYGVNTEESERGAG